MAFKYQTTREVHDSSKLHGAGSFPLPPLHARKSFVILVVTAPLHSPGDARYPLEVINTPSPENVF